MSTAEAERRLAEFGPNRLRSEDPPSLLRGFARSLTHFLAVILWVAAVLAFLAEWRAPGGGMAVLGAAIVGVILINGAFSFWQEYRAERAIAALHALLPHRVTAMRDGVTVEMPGEQLVPGDVVLLQEGDDVPADCRVLDAFGLRVNAATITGEALPVAKDEHPSDVDDILQSRNVLLAGTSVVSGEARAVVFATGMRTAFGAIARLTQISREPLSPLQRQIVHVSRIVAVLALALGAVFFVIGWAIGLNLWTNALFAVGLIVANVPEGLLPTVSLSLAMASQRMAKRQALVRHLPSIETLGSATVICTDKTGTLTQNRMAVARLVLPGVVSERDALRLADLAAQPGASAVADIAVRCQTLRQVAHHHAGRPVGDPLEVALAAMAAAMRADPRADDNVTRVDEVPFDTERKRLSVLYRTPGGSVLYTKGAPETVLPLCTSIRVKGVTEPLTGEWRGRMMRAQNALARRGLRVLALADRAAPADRGSLEEGLTLAGLVGLEDPPRPEVPQAIATCRRAGITVMMVTGDHPLTALAIAREIGLVRGERPRIVLGDELRRLSETQLQLTVATPEVLFARVGADQKLRIVEALQARGDIVAVTGDGVNDAPALKRADIGIAMGRSGTDVAREAADMVLLDDNFASIVAAVEEGRSVFANIRKFLTYILTSNVPEIVPYLAFALFTIPLPLTVMQILAVDLGTDMLPALALGAERPRPTVMDRPPRPPTERLLTPTILARAYLFLGVLEAAGGMAAFFLVLADGGWQYGQPLAADAPLYRQATAACLSAIVVMQVANVFACRDPRASVWSIQGNGNRLLPVAIAVELALLAAIDYTAVGRMVFGTAAFPGWLWVIVIAFAATLLLMEELRKFIVRLISGYRGEASSV